jgi:hypothetical protein
VKETFVTGVQVYVPVPEDPNRGAAAEELGVGRISAELSGKVAAHERVRRYAVLRKQVEAAQTKIADAEKAVRRVAALRQLHEDDPTPNLAADLAEADRGKAAAEVARAAAERDLATIQTVVARHYASTAESVEREVDVALTTHKLALLDRSMKARTELQKIAPHDLGRTVTDPTEVARRIGRARELLGELALLESAIRRLELREQFLALELIAAALGPTPTGVEKGPDGRYKLAESPRPVPAGR